MSKLELKEGKEESKGIHSLSRKAKGEALKKKKEHKHKEKDCECGK